jgi:simple sugar transport system ATP-binding protein
VDYAIEMLHITKEFPGIKANDDITLQVKQGEIHALLGENGAGKSTLMSILFGLYQPDIGTIKIHGQEVKINDPNDANKYKIGMVHQHFKLVHNFTVLENIILGIEETGFAGKIKRAGARKKVMELSEKYHLNVDPDAKIEDITVGMQQRVEILKMLFRDNEILIFDEPTAVLTPQEIDELMHIMKDLIKEGKSIIFITHKLNEIKAVADRCTIIRKGKYVDTVNVADVSKEQLSELMVGHKVNFIVDKAPAQPGDTVLHVEHLTYQPKGANKPLLNDVSFDVRRGEIVCIAGIDGNGQSELVYNISGIENPTSGKITLNGKDITHDSIRHRNDDGLAVIPEDRHKHGLVLDYNVAENMILKSYYKPEYQSHGFIKFDEMYKNADHLIEEYDVRSGEGAKSSARGMSGGNQQKAIVAREIESGSDLLIAVQPTRGLDVGAIEFIHKQIVKHRDNNKAVLLVSLELDEVMTVSDRILVMYEGEIVGDLDPKQTNVKELGLYMAGSKRGAGYEK